MGRVCRNASGATRRIRVTVEKTLGRSGRPFVQLVLEALDANRITSVDACRYLDLRFDHVEKLRQELAGGPRGHAHDADGGD